MEKYYNVKNQNHTAPKINKQKTKCIELKSKIVF